VVGVHLLFNLFLILWLRRVFLPYHRRSLSAVAGRGLLDDFYRRHGISNREKEIAELILLGKSNRDIEHQLFISPHTVKNHIYNLYQKSGVKSRSQLIHLILRSNNQN
jgi:DNA-binding CsgD family transcriptional regulator